MADLTQDEVTVLMIAAEGESMMPIGRWEAPVESLIKKGYLHRADKFNNYITDAGRHAVQLQEDANIESLVEATNQIVSAQEKCAARGREISALLAELATFSAAVTGAAKMTELKRWARVILEDAKGKLE